MANASILAAFERMWQHVINKLSEKSDVSHTHDERYYTESEIDTKLSPLATSTSVTNSISTHNTATGAHADIRNLIDGLTNRLNALADSDDTTLDQMSEIVAYIKANKALIDSITTSKVNVADIINNLTTNVTNKPLSAAQGVTLKGLIDDLQAELDSHTHAIADVSGLQAALDGKAASSHGIHVTYSTTAPAMDGTAGAGSAATVARSDHKHPTDTSRAAKSDLDNHVADTAKHITTDERTKLAGIAAGAEVNVQSDWNQNDETAKDHIKNRPFYDAGVQPTEVFYNEYFELDSDSENSFDYLLKLNTTYKVEWNGVEYECVSYLYDDQPTIAIGNYTIADTMWGTDSSEMLGASTNEPFFIAYSENPYGDKWGGTLVETAGIYSVRVTEYANQIVKIDEKFLPPMVGKNVAGQTFEVWLGYDADGNDIVQTCTAKKNAESFNNFNFAIGASSHAEGEYTTAFGAMSHSEGAYTIASGAKSHAEGEGSIAEGIASHAEGYFTEARGGNAHAEGMQTKALGHYSHAEGSNTIASGHISHAEGEGTIAEGKWQHVQGKFNVELGDSYLHIVGNGSNNNSRSNAYTLGSSGTAWFAGDVYVGSTSGTNRDSGSKKLATSDEITAAVSNAVDNLRVTITTVVMSAANWNASAKTYSFESTYPAATHDLELELNGDVASEAQFEAFNAAMMVASANTNVVKAFGEIPTIDIPVILKVQVK